MMLTRLGERKPARLVSRKMPDIASRVLHAYCARVLRAHAYANPAELSKEWTECQRIAHPRTSRDSCTCADCIVAFMPRNESSWSVTTIGAPLYRYILTAHRS